MLACVAYADLDPIRAELATDLPGSAHTSVERLLAEPRQVNTTTPLQPVEGPVSASVMPATLVDYLELADWTWCIARADKRASIAATRLRLLRRLELTEDQWRTQATGIEQRYWWVVGAVDALIGKARDLGQFWLKGTGAACR